MTQRRVFIVLGRFKMIDLYTASPPNGCEASVTQDALKIATR